MKKDRKKVVFMNGGKHFWNREKDIVRELNKYFEVHLFIIHKKRSTNYTIEEIINYCNKHAIHLTTIDFTNRRSRSITKIFSDLKYVLKIKKINPEIIYIENFASPYFAFFASLLFKAQNTIIAILDYKLHPYEKGVYKFSERFYRFLYLYCFKNYHLFSYDQAHLMKLDFPKKNISVTHLYLIGSDLPKPIKLQSDENHIINFLFFGKVHYYKGLDILIKAVNKLSKRESNFKVTIAGYCENFSEYEKLIENKNFFDLKIYYLEKNELPELFSKTDFFVAPYREVTQSGPLMIAYNYRVIPIASDIGGFKEHITDNLNGFLFKSESSIDLARVMEKAITLKKTKKEKIYRGLQNYIKHEFDLNRLTKKYIDFINSTIDNRHYLDY